MKSQIMLIVRALKDKRWERKRENHKKENILTSALQNPKVHMAKEKKSTHSYLKTMVT